MPVVYTRPTPSPGPALQAVSDDLGTLNERACRTDTSALQPQAVTVTALPLGDHELHSTAASASRDSSDTFTELVGRVAAVNRRFYVANKCFSSSIARVWRRKVRSDLLVAQNGAECWTSGQAVSRPARRIFSGSPGAAGQRA